jgi:hypothetical protein
MPTMKDTSNHEALGGMMKKKPAMAHSSPGTTSHKDEALGGKSKKKPPMAHMGPATTSHEDEALGGMAKKKPAMVGNRGNTAAGDAAGAI